MSRATIGRIVPLRAVLAIVFLILMSLQPGLMTTASAAGLHGKMAMTVDAELPMYQADEHRHVLSDRGGTGGQEAGDQHHHGKQTADKVCEVHCAPMSTIPVACPALLQPTARFHAAEPGSVLQPGEYADFMRPPRA